MQVVQKNTAKLIFEKFNIGAKKANSSSQTEEVEDPRIPFLEAQVKESDHYISDLQLELEGLKKTYKQTEVEYFSVSSKYS